MYNRIEVYKAWEGFQFLRASIDLPTEETQKAVDLICQLGATGDQTTIVITPIARPDINDKPTED